MKYYQKSIGFLEQAITRNTLPKQHFQAITRAEGRDMGRESGSSISGEGMGAPLPVVDFAEHARQRPRNGFCVLSGVSPELVGRWRKLSRTKTPRIGPKIETPPIQCIRALHYRLRGWKRHAGRVVGRPRELEPAPRALRNTKL